MVPVTLNWAGFNQEKKHVKAKVQVKVQGKHFPDMPTTIGGLHARQGRSMMRETASNTGLHFVVDCVYEFWFCVKTHW